MINFTFRAIKVENKSFFKILQQLFCKTSAISVPYSAADAALALKGTALSAGTASGTGTFDHPVVYGFEFSTPPSKI